MSQTLIIGDIHGCYDELQALLDKAGLAAEDQIIALGDVVDRGPASPAVWRFFASNAQARSLQGNHERKHLRGARGELALARSQQIARAQFGDDYPAALAWMAELPLYIKLPEALLLHGYLAPGLPLVKQRETVLAGTMGGEGHLRGAGLWPWYAYIDVDRPVIVGHKQYRNDYEPFVYSRGGRERVFGLDTGCCRGGRLTGLLLPQWQLIQAPAARDYWTEVRRVFPVAAPPRPLTPESLPFDELAAYLRRAADRAYRAPADPVQTAELDRLHTVLQETEALLPYLRAQIIADARAINARLALEADAAELSPRAWARRFDAAVAPDDPRRALLHVARQDDLTAARTRKLVRSPAQALTIATYIERRHSP